MSAVSPLQPVRRPVRAILAAVALAGGLVVGQAAAAHAQECSISRGDTTAVTLGANIASEPGVSVSVSHTASGVSGATWTASGLPGGVGFDSSSGTISGAAAGGQYAVSVTATGADGTTCTRSFTWFVNEAESGVITPELPPEQIPAREVESAPPATPTAAPGAESEGTLAFTGGDVAGMLVVGFGALGLGVLLVWTQRRRRVDEPAG
jgi:hypothetical protein